MQTTQVVWSFSLLSPGYLKITNRVISDYHENLLEQKENISGRAKFLLSFRLFGELLTGKRAAVRYQTC